MYDLILPHLTISCNIPARDQKFHVLATKPRTMSLNRPRYNAKKLNDSFGGKARNLQQLCVETEMPKGDFVIADITLPTHSPSMKCSRSGTCSSFQLSF